MSAFHKREQRNHDNYKPEVAAPPAAISGAAGGMPLATSRHPVTILWISPCELFAVVIQLIKDFTSFDDMDLGLVLAMC